MFNSEEEANKEAGQAIAFFCPNHASALVSNQDWGKHKDVQFNEDILTEGEFNEIMVDFIKNGIWDKLRR